MRLTEVPSRRLRQELRRQLRRQLWPGLRWWAVLSCAAMVWVTSAVAAKPNPNGPLRIPVDALGYMAMPPILAAQGRTELTLNFVDETHLLFTFTARTLMPRLPDAAPDDQDRNVAAVLLELPTGRVIARTEWRLRDHDKYLWPLGEGRFLLRVRSRLTLLAPLENLAEHGPGEVFRQQAFLSLKRPIGYLAVSPGGDLLGIETVPPPTPTLIGGAASAAALAATVPGSKPPTKTGREGRAPVQIFFVRLSREKTHDGRALTATSAGVIGAPNLIELPATGEGYLEINRDTGPQKGWLFDFVSHTGKRMELSGYQTSCAPRPFWISRSEFVAFGCSGSTSKQELSYFNLKGEQPWLQMLHGTHVSPSIVAAPAAGRFALSRTLVDATIFDVQELTADLLQAQEITVLQAHDGRTLLKVLADPIHRVGQNFDLSANGMQFAVFRAGHLEIYPLPALNSKDQTELRSAIEQYPPPNESLIRLNAEPVKLGKGEQEEEAPAQEQSSAEGAATLATPTEPASGELPAAAAKPEIRMLQNGDAAPAEPGDQVPRKRPSLYPEGAPNATQNASPAKHPL